MSAPAPVNRRLADFVTQAMTTAKYANDAKGEQVRANPHSVSRQPAPLAISARFGFRVFRVVRGSFPLRSAICPLPSAALRAHRVAASPLYATHRVAARPLYATVA